MKTLRILAVAAALCAVASAADAAQIRMCSPITVNGAPQGRWAAPNSGTNYTKDARGCMRISPADLGDARAAGFISDPPVAVAYHLTGPGSVVLPPSAYIDSITVQEDSGGTVSNGLNVGTTAGGIDVVSGTTSITGNTIKTITDALTLKRAFSSTAPQTLFFSSGLGTYLTQPQYTVTIHYSYF